MIDVFTVTCSVAKSVNKCFNNGWKEQVFFLMTIQMMLRNFKWCCHYNTTLHSIIERRWSTLLISKLWIKCHHCQFKIANLARCIVEWGIFRSPWYLHFLNRFFCNENIVLVAQCISLISSELFESISWLCGSFRGNIMKIFFIKICYFLFWNNDLLLFIEWILA